MQQPQIVPHDEWLKARLELLAAEKEFTRQRDALTRLRMQMPLERVEKDYRFEGPGGMLGLADLFEGRSQLIIYHFMLGPDWQAGCKSCSFWADNFSAIPVHLRQRDVTLALVSRAPIGNIEAYRRRMGWNLTWVSSAGSDFNFDYRVSFTPEQIAAGTAEYNYAGYTMKSAEMPGLSVFWRDAAGAVFHSYSCYARGLDMLNGAYQLLDLVPKGRDEPASGHKMAWVQRHDEY